MKKISIALMLFLTVAGSSFANGQEGLPEFKGEKHFTENFPGATNVDCKTTERYTKVDFTWRELKLEVFYDKEGNLIATCRQIPFENLPLTLQLNVNKEYPGFVPTDVSEFNDANDGLCYYMTVTNEATTYLLHISLNGSIYVFKKMKN
jgi:hypothetical protein